MIDLQSIFKDYLPPIATIIASITAASVAAIFARKQAEAASLQAKIALEKLKYDTLADRVDVLKAAHELIRYSFRSNDKKLADRIEMGDIRERIEKSKFLFSEEVFTYLEIIVGKCYDAAQFLPSLPADEFRALDEANQIAHRETITDRMEAKKFIIKHRREMANKISDEISLDFLRNAHKQPPKSWKAILLILYILIAVLTLMIFAMGSYAVKNSYGP